MVPIGRFLPSWNVILIQEIPSPCSFMITLFICCIWWDCRVSYCSSDNTFGYYKNYHSSKIHERNVSYILLCYYSNIFLQTGKQIVQEHGAAALFRGMTPRVMGFVPIAAFNFFVLEYAKKLSIKQ